MPPERWKHFREFKLTGSQTKEMSRYFREFKLKLSQTNEMSRYFREFKLTISQTKEMFQLNFGFTPRIASGSSNTIF